MGQSEDDSPAQDLAHVAFFLAEFQPVTRDNVWAYFRASPFYDFRCLDEYIAMQGADRSKLETEDGTFYKVSDKGFGGFSITRYVRETKGLQQQETCHECYYVWDGTIYRAPTTMAVLAKKLRNVAHQVAAALHNTHQHITYGLPDGYQWTLPDDPAKPVGGPSPGPSTVHHAASPRFAGHLQELVGELQQAAAAQPPESPPPAKRARVAPAGPGGADVALLPPRPLPVKMEGNALIML